MDPVTQTALGATIGAVFQPKLGRRAIFFGAFCGAIPDVDVFFDGGDEWASLVYHRGGTHSLLMLALAAPVFGFLGSLMTGRRNLWTWTQLSFWALITHTLLDWCTPYGTQLFWPLTDRRFANDAVAVIDPLYTVVLLLACLIGIMPFLTAKTVRRCAVIALAISTGYLILGFVQSRRAIAWAEPQLRRSGFESVETRAAPTLLNLFVRRVVARDADGRIAVGHVSTWSPRPIEFQFIDRDDDPLIERALASREGKILHWFSMDMLSAQVERRPDGASVILSDQRYGMLSDPTASPFRAEAEFDADGELIRVRRLRRDRPRNVRAELALLRRMWFGEPH